MPAEPKAKIKATHRCKNYSTKKLIFWKNHEVPSESIFRVISKNPDPIKSNYNIMTTNKVDSGIFDKSSVIRQKGESQNGCFKKTKHVEFSEKQAFLTPWYAHILASLFLPTSFWDSLFCLITDIIYFEITT